MPTVMLAIACAMALAWWSWRGRLHNSLAWCGAAARAVALAALLLLVLDPGVAMRPAPTRPLVLLDRSVSMLSATADRAGTDRFAASLGDTIPFGELAPGIAGDDSRLTEPLATALRSERPVIVVTDGEIADARAIPAELFARATLHVRPRGVRPDIALTAVRAPHDVTAGDTLTIEIDAQRAAGAGDSAIIVVRDSDRVLTRGAIHFVGPMATLRLRVVIPARTQGERWLVIAREGPADGEPGDDVRWLPIAVSTTPAVVVLSATPDFDGRALYRALHDVLGLPVRGYVQLRQGEWWRMDDLRVAPPSEVIAAARHADLLAVRGDVTPWRNAGRERLLWPDGTRTGDWYTTGVTTSPVGDAFVGVDADSLPPATAVLPLAVDSVHGWVGMTARLARQGVAAPVVIGGADGATRTVTIGADGLFRWSLRGGVARQAWRTMIADAASWLLAAPEGDSVRARLVTAVVPRGEPVRFRWVGPGAPVPVGIRIASGGRSRVDTLRFDAAGTSTLALPVGRYQYLFDGHAGWFGVEPYSPEFMPSAVTVRDHVATSPVSPVHRPLRDMLWLFGLAVLAFAVEWVLRRRLGLR